MNPLSIIPLKGWLYAGAALALLAGYVYWHHHVFEQGVASTQPQVDAANLRAQRAMDANTSFATAVATLKMAQAQCEAGRLADQSAAAAALAQRDAQTTTITDNLRAARAKLAASLYGVCKNWASQPACGVTP